MKGGKAYDGTLKDGALRMAVNPKAAAPQEALDRMRKTQADILAEKIQILP